MKLTWRQFLYLILLVFSCLIVFVNKSFFIENFVDPLTRLVWLIFRTFRAIDQQVAWTLLIIGAVIIGLLMIPGRQEFSTRSSYLRTGDEKDRVRFWQQKFRAADKDAASRVALQESLQSMSGSIHELTGLDEAAEFPPCALPPKSRLVGALKIRHWFSGVVLRRQTFEDSKLEARFNQILDTMEFKMETKNDRTPGNPSTR